MKPESLWLEVCTDDVVIGPGDKDVYKGMPYVYWNPQRIGWTSDVPEYSWISTDELLDLLYTLGAYRVEVRQHIHEGKKHDRDYIVPIRPDVRMKELFLFVLSLYDEDEWCYARENE